MYVHVYMHVHTYIHTHTHYLHHSHIHEDLPAATGPLLLISCSHWNFTPAHWAQPHPGPGFLIQQEAWPGQVHTLGCYLLVAGLGVSVLGRFFTSWPVYYSWELTPCPSKHSFLSYLPCQTTPLPLPKRARAHWITTTAVIPDSYRTYRVPGVPSGPTRVGKMLAPLF